MTPKEKAKDLVEKYYHLFSVTLENTISIYEAKNCALIAIDEILNAIDWHEFETPNLQLYYWEKVKNEIEKL